MSIQMFFSNAPQLVISYFLSWLSGLFIPMSQNSYHGYQVNLNN